MNIALQHVNSSNCTSEDTPPNSSVNGGSSNNQKTVRQRQWLSQRRTKPDIFQEIAIEATTLPKAPFYQYCRENMFYLWPPNFCCLPGEIRLLEIEIPRELMLLYQSDSKEVDSFRNCVRS